MCVCMHVSMYVCVCLCVFVCVVVRAYRDLPLPIISPSDTLRRGNSTSFSVFFKLSFIELLMYWQLLTTLFNTATEWYRYVVHYTTHTHTNAHTHTHTHAHIHTDTSITIVTHTEYSVTSILDNL